MSEHSTSRKGFLAKSGALLASLATFGFLRSAQAAPVAAASERKVAPATRAVPRAPQR